MSSVTNTSDFAFEQTDELLGRLILQIGRTVKSRSPDTVHDLRVTIRRFTQPLIVFKPCFPAKEWKKAGRSLKRIMSAAGRVRDTDTAVALVSRFATEDQQSLLGQLKQQRRQTEQELALLLKRRLDAKWRSRLLASGPATDRAFCRRGIVDTAHRTLPRLSEDFYKRGNRAARPKSSPEDIHRFRLAVKKLRYTLELFASMYDSTLSSILEDVRTLQSLLGEVSDCDTTRKMIARLGAGREIDARLRKRQRGKIQLFRTQWMEKFAMPGADQRWIDFLTHQADQQRKPPSRSGSSIAGAAKASVAVA